MLGAPAPSDCLPNSTAEGLGVGPVFPVPFFNSGKSADMEREGRGCKVEPNRWCLYPARREGGGV